MWKPNKQHKSQNLPVHHHLQIQKSLNLIHCQGPCHQISVLLKATQKTPFRLGLKPCIPGMLNQMFGNQKLNQIKSVDWIQLRSPIKQNQTLNFGGVPFPNQSNSIEQSKSNLTQSIRLCSTGFSSQTQPNAVHWIAFDRVLLKRRLCFVVSKTWKTRVKLK